MKYIDRKGNITIEENSQDKLLRHLYNDRGGRLCLKLLIRPFVSKSGGNSIEHQTFCQICT